ncbi:MAG: hypothetical protein EZS28_037959 [Streblomastix strix]|uniref:Uncharacterized protein n=1 Tax=Streblomastix strix TaxID=222440 RepID=A0A5J4U8E6_9EUKA|nr:MAG: hypothetical protein EZS28_037959 [Streblomastix strix]
MLCRHPLHEMMLPVSLLQMWLRWILLDLKTNFSTPNSRTKISSKLRRFRSIKNFQPKMILKLQETVVSGIYRAQQLGS